MIELLANFFLIRRRITPVFLVATISFMGALVLPQSASAYHRTNRPEIESGLRDNDGGGWIVLYSKEISHAEEAKLSVCIAADVIVSAGSCTSTYFSNFAQESLQNLLQEASTKAPSIINQIRSELTLNKILGAVKASFNGSRVSLSIAGMEFQVGRSTYNRAECTDLFGRERCISTPNTYQPYIRFRVAASTSKQNSSFIKLRNRNWGRCLNLQSATQNGVQPNVWECVPHPDQEWKIEDVGNGFVKLRNRNWGRCLNLQSATQNGVQPNVWECVPHPDQEWKIENAS